VRRRHARLRRILVVDPLGQVGVRPEVIAVDAFVKLAAVDVNDRVGRIRIQSLQLCIADAGSRCICDAHGSGCHASRPVDRRRKARDDGNARSGNAVSVRDLLPACVTVRPCLDDIIVGSQILWDREIHIDIKARSVAVVPQMIVAGGNALALVDREERLKGIECLGLRGVCSLQHPAVRDGRAGTFDVRIVVVYERVRDRLDGRANRHDLAGCGRAGNGQAEIRQADGCAFISPGGSVIDEQIILRLRFADAFGEQIEVGAGDGMVSGRGADRGSQPVDVDDVADLDHVRAGAVCCFIRQGVPVLDDRFAAELVNLLLHGINLCLCCDIRRQRDVLDQQGRRVVYALDHAALDEVEDFKFIVRGIHENRAEVHLGTQGRNVEEDAIPGRVDAVQDRRNLAHGRCAARDLDDLLDVVIDADVRDGLPLLRVRQGLSGVETNRTGENGRGLGGTSSGVLCKVRSILSRPVGPFRSVFRSGLSLFYSGIYYTIYIRSNTLFCRIGINLFQKRVYFLSSKT